MFGINNTINNTINKIQFHGIKTVYPVGERVSCFFTVPEFLRQPESGDWIGIFPVGWTSIVRDCVCRQVVRVEQLTGQYGKVEFDLFTLPQFGQQQQYQFVYVTNAGEYVVLGTSTPFRFHPLSQYQPQQQLEQEQLETLIGGRRFYGNEWNTTTNGIETVRPWGRFGVETEVQKLQNEIVNLEQGLWQQQPQFNGEFVVGQTGARGMWQPRLVKIEQILKEKIKIEQAQRRLDQWCILAQLKSCERHIVNVQKREPEIRDFLFRTKMQVKIAAFEQKVNNIIKMNYRGVELQTPVEYYVRKYETLLREKVQVEVEKRRTVLHKLRLTIKECERKLRELQTIDQEHFVNFHVMLKTKVEQCGIQIFNAVEINEMTKHFENVMGSFLFEQDKLFLNLVQAQKELYYLTNEVCTKLQELEIESGCYSTLRIPKIVTGLMFHSHPRLAQIVNLEKKIAEQKLRLKLKVLASTGVTGGWTGVPTRVVEQLTRGVWFGPVIEKLRLIQYQLNKSLSVFPIVERRDITVTDERFFVEKKIATVQQLINSLVNYQTEVVCPSSLFDQAKLRQVLTHLREVRERECIEIPRFFKGVQTTIVPVVTVVELCQHLNEILTEKIAEMTNFVQWFGQQYHQRQQIPFEVMFGTTYGIQHIPAMLELIEVEKKLVEMKGMTLAGIHYMHLDERLAELETVFLRNIEQGNKRERCIEKIRVLKGLLDEHVEFQPSFVTVPEKFFQHQQKYEKLCQLVGELECHFIEQVTVPQYVQPTTLFGGEFVEFQGRQRGVNGARFFNFNMIHHKFMRLVQEFQVQFPECFTPKVEEIVAFLRNVIVNEKLGMVQPFDMQELKEKLVEFETILCQPECEIACLTTSIFPQSTTTTMRTQRECLKFIIRQVRELKTQVHYMLVNNGGFVNTVETDRLVDLMDKRLWIEKKNNENVESFDRFVRVNPIGGGRQQQQQQQQQQLSTIVETTTVNTGYQQPTVVVKSGLIRPVEKMIAGGEVEERIVNKVRFQQNASFELVDEDELLFDDEEDFDFIGGENNGQFFNKEVEVACVCQIEKHIRKCLGDRFAVETGFEKQVVCPFCTSSVETRTTTTRHTTVGDVVVRRF